MEIPKIIHQIWSGVQEPLPESFRILGDTWKNDYPTWQYEFWDNDRMNVFVQDYYPQYWAVYTKYPYNVQRWDAIRYLILDKMGGMYVDFDYESLEAMDDLVKGRSCCFALEKPSCCQTFNKEIMFNNALMLSVPGHPFMRKIVEAVFSEERLKYDTSSKNDCVLNTTGPWILIDLYQSLTEQEKVDVYLIPDKYVTPWDVPQAFRYRMIGDRSDELENCLEEAYALHYFTSNWRLDNL